MGLEEASFRANDSFIQDREEKEAVLPRGGDREDASARRPHCRRGGNVRPAKEARGDQAGFRASEALARTRSAAQRHGSQLYPPAKNRLAIASLPAAGRPAPLGPDSLVGRKR